MRRKSMPNISRRDFGSKAVLTSFGLNSLFQPRRAFADITIANTYKVICPRNDSVIISFRDILDEIFNARMQDVTLSFTQPPFGILNITRYNPRDFEVRFTPDHDWSGTTDFDIRTLHYGVLTKIRVRIEVSGLGSSYAWTHSFPNAAQVDPTKIKLWIIGTPVPRHNVGDIILGIGPKRALIGATPISGSFKGPLVLTGLTLEPTGNLAADYSTSAAPVLGTTALIQPTFTSDARSHWTWEGVNWPFLFVSNTYVDYRANECSFGDFIRVQQSGHLPNASNGSFAGPKAIVILNKIYMRNGPHYVSNTVKSGSNGHSDGIQSLGGIPVYRAADCYFNWPGGQLFFSGREAADCGWPRSTRWDMRNVAMDHGQFWNKNVRSHVLNTNAAFVKAYEAENGAFELYDYKNGKYMAINFSSQCYVRGRFSLSDAVNVRKYIGGSGGINGIDSNGNWKFNTLINGNHTYPAYAGRVRYLPPGARLPQTCNPDHTGCALAISSVAQFMNILRS